MAHRATGQLVLRKGFASAVPLPSLHQKACSFAAPCKKSQELCEILLLFGSVLLVSDSRSFLVPKKIHRHFFADLLLAALAQDTRALRLIQGAPPLPHSIPRPLTDHTATLKELIFRFLLHQ